MKKVTIEGKTTIFEENIDFSLLLNRSSTKVLFIYLFIYFFIYLFFICLFIYLFIFGYLKKKISFFRPAVQFDSLNLNINWNREKDFLRYPLSEY